MLYQQTEPVFFYRLKQTGKHMFSVGFFDAEAGEAFVFDCQVFIHEKPSMHAFANDTEDMTGAEVFAKYGGSTSFAKGEYVGANCCLVLLFGEY